MSRDIPGEQRLRDDWRKRSPQIDWREPRNRKKIAVGGEGIEVQGSRENSKARRQSSLTVQLRGQKSLKSAEQT